MEAFHDIAIAFIFGDKASHGPGYQRMHPLRLKILKRITIDDVDIAADTCVVVKNRAHRFSQQAAKVRSKPCTQTDPGSCRQSRSRFGA